MDGICRKVVQLHPHRISPEDADAIEMIMQVHCGEEVSIARMEVTEESIDSIRTRMAAEQGVTFLESTGWRFPVMQWKYTATDGGRLVLTVVDQGRRRVFRHRVEKS